MFDLNFIFVAIIGLLVVLLVLAIAKKLVKFLIAVLIILAIVGVVWFLLAKLGIAVDFAL